MNRGSFRHFARRARPAWLVTALALLVLPSHAATRLWTGKGKTAKWSEAGNWKGRVPQAGDSVVFPAGIAKSTCTNDVEDLPLFSITFSGSNYVVYGNPLSVRGDVRADQVSGQNVFHPNLRLSGSITSICARASASLFLGGDIELNGNLLTLAGNGTNELAGAISGFNGLTKVGTGTLILSGSRRNTYINANFSEGTVFLRKTVPNGAMVGVVTVGKESGAANVNVIADSRVPQLNGGTIFISAGARLALGNARESAGDVTGEGRLELNGTVFNVIGHPPGYYHPGFGGDISGSGEVQKVTLNEFTLNGTNTFTGQITVVAGILALNGELLHAQVKVNKEGMFTGSGVTNMVKANNGTFFPPRRTQ